MDDQSKIGLGIALIVAGVLGAAFSGPMETQAARTAFFESESRGQSMQAMAQLFKFGGIGLGLGGAALLVAGLIGQTQGKQQSTAGGQDADQETKKCPLCAETIKLEAVKCRYCGADFDPHEVATQVQTRKAAVANKDTYLCPQCLRGGLVSDAMLSDGSPGWYCPRCWKYFHREELCSSEATSSEDPPSLESLLGTGRDIEKADDLGNTPLLQAVRKGRLDAVKVLLDNGANIGATNNEGNAGLHVAARNGDEEMLALLIERGADINVKNRAGNGPFAFAALSDKANRLQVLKLLASRGASTHMFFVDLLSLRLVSLFDPKTKDIVALIDRGGTAM